MALEITEDRICPACQEVFKDSEKLLKCKKCGVKFDIKENKDACQRTT